MKAKKSYRKPELKVRKIELGVFGEYGRTEDPISPENRPVETIRDLDLHME